MDIPKAMSAIYITFWDEYRAMKLWPMNIILKKKKLNTRKLAPSK